MESNRGSPKEHGDFPPLFLAMPFKDALFQNLKAIESALDPFQSLIYVKAGDQGTDPAPDCSALHIPRNLIFSGGSFTFTGSYFPFTGIPFFDSNGVPTGDLAPPLLAVSLEPPYDD